MLRLPQGDTLIELRLRRFTTDLIDEGDRFAAGLLWADAFGDDTMDRLLPNSSTTRPRRHLADAAIAVRRRPRRNLHHRSRLQLSR
jgi:hypothetical protein